MSDSRSRSPHVRPRTRTFPLLLLLIPALQGQAGQAEEASSRALQRIQDMSLAIEALASRVKPAVVEIMVTGYGVSVDRQTATGEISKKVAGGSGVLVDPDGYIVTNAHVIEGAQEILVGLAPSGKPDARASILQGRGEMIPAKLLGLDGETDLAVLKIEGGDYDYLELADIKDLRQGRVVFAFGSPLGLENSVSMGVVSSVARQLTPESPMIYIQTDAAINPGNSGGPLVDIEGRVVGINTMIFSQSGGNEGIGFAAPSHIVGTVYRSIRKEGRVRRAFIGTSAQTITPMMARGLGLSMSEGVILGDVFPGGPAAVAGLLAGDIVTHLDGKLMENGRQFEVNLYFKEIGGTIDIDYIRGLEPRRTTVDVIERPDSTGILGELPNLERGLVAGLGIIAVPLNEEIARRLPRLRATAGVLVAARAGALAGGSSPLRTGDVIYSVNGSRIETVGGLRAFVDETSSGQPLILQVERQGRLQYVTTLRE